MINDDFRIICINIWVFLFRYLEKLFPALDITRMAVRHQNTCTHLIKLDILGIIIENINKPPANQLMSIRCLVNMMNHGYGRGLIEVSLNKIIRSLSVIRGGSVNLQV